jgi:hypothetical protein
MAYLYAYTLKAGPRTEGIGMARNTFSCDNDTANICNSQLTRQSEQPAATLRTVAGDNLSPDENAHKDAHSNLFAGKTSPRQVTGGCACAMHTGIQAAARWPPSLRASIRPPPGGCNTVDAPSAPTRCTRRYSPRRHSPAQPACNQPINQNSNCGHLGKTAQTHNSETVMLPTRCLGHTCR